MAKDQNTFAKRQREMWKKQKAEDKRARRKKKKEQVKDAVEPDAAEKAADE